MQVDILVIRFFILQSTHSSHTWLLQNLLSPRRHHHRRRDEELFGKIVEAIPFKL